MVYKSHKQEVKQTTRHALRISYSYNYSNREKVMTWSLHVKQLSALSTKLTRVACTDFKDRMVMKSELRFSINVNI